MNTGLIKQSISIFGQKEFSRSGGPGGQNVNKVNTKVNLRIRLGDIEGLNETETARLRVTLAQRITNEDEIIISASEERSQRTNLERAYSHMENLIINAARVPRARRPTKPTAASREKRLKEKRRLGILKTGRRYAHEE